MGENWAMLGNVCTKCLPDNLSLACVQHWIKQNYIIPFWNDQALSSFSERCYKAWKKKIAVVPTLKQNSPSVQFESEWIHLYLSTPPVTLQCPSSDTDLRHALRGGSVRAMSSQGWIKKDCWETESLGWHSSLPFKYLQSLNGVLRQTQTRK